MFFFFSFWGWFIIFYVFYRVISQNNEVNGFMLDPSIGEFVLTDPKMTIPKTGAGKKNLYSINEGYENKWEPAVLEYVKSKKVGPKPYGARYIGSMVADVHRTIKYGGVFMYPKTTDAPKGKLRVLYECFPMVSWLEYFGFKLGALGSKHQKNRIFSPILFSAEAVEKENKLLIGPRHFFSVCQLKKKS